MYSKFVGITAETAALIEQYREHPQESEDEIIRRKLTSRKAIEGGCDLGKGAMLYEGEKLYFFRNKQSRAAGKPEAVAESKHGNLFLYGERIQPSKGSLVAPALSLVQARLNDKNAKGQFISLDAWKYWFVSRGGKLIEVGDLRDPDQIAHRRASAPLAFKTHLSLEELGL
jgi:hypothetical protein